MAGVGSIGTTYAYGYLNNRSGGLHKILQKDNPGLKISPVTKNYSVQYNSAESKNSGDYMWLLSFSEIGGSQYAATTKEGNAYRYYKDNNSNDCLVKKYNGTPFEWFLRSVSNNDSHCFGFVLSNGTKSVSTANYNPGIAPCFSIGENPHTARELKTTYPEITTWSKLCQIANLISADPTVTPDTEEVRVYISADGVEWYVGVGDIMPITYNGTSYNVRVLGFKHDRISDSTKYAGISMEFTGVLTSKKMRSDLTNVGGWRQTSGDCVYTYLNDGTNGLYKVLQADTANAGLTIAKVDKQYLYQGNGDSTLLTGQDFMWPLAMGEIWAGESLYTCEGEQYKYYKRMNLNISTAYSTTCASLQRGQYWWLRTPYAGTVQHIDCVNTSGKADCYTSNTSLYISPCFAIGQ